MRLFIALTLLLGFSLQVYAGCCNPAGNSVPGFSACPNNPNQCCNNGGQSNNSITPQNCSGSASGSGSSGSGQNSCAAPGFLVLHTLITNTRFDTQLNYACKVYMGNNPGTTQCCITWQQVQSACSSVGGTLVNVSACSNSIYVFGPVKNAGITKTCCK